MAGESLHHILPDNLCHFSVYLSLAGSSASGGGGGGEEGGGGANEGTV